MNGPLVYRHANEVPSSSLGAAHIVPVILRVVGNLESVVDVGGGTGAWLHVFRQHGVNRVLLVDDPSVAAGLLVERDEFLPCDLNANVPELPRCDLAVCVECAEHLQPGRAESLVACLTGAADVVVFSAAVPGQCGNGHINNQPPDYWRELFARHGFVRHDALRAHLLHEPEVPWWYRQNLFLFARPGVLPHPPEDFLPDEFELIHCSIIAALRRPGLRATSRQLVLSLARAIRSRIGKRGVS
jgi:hypothetical protein